MHRFHLPTMTCGGCLKAVTRAIHALDAEARVEGDLNTRTIAVASRRAADDLMKALAAAGYPAAPLAPQAA